MITKTLNPASVLKAIRYFTTATSTYKPVIDHQFSPERFTTKPKRHIAEAVTVPSQHTRGSSLPRFSKSFQLRYRKVHAYSMTASATKELESSFGEDRFSRRWYERTDSLWWTVIAFKVFAAKRVVRSYGTRKLRVAFVESLKKRGIASDGSWLSPQAQQSRDPVMGTAHLSPSIEVLTTRMEDLVLETDKAVELILKWQTRIDIEPKIAKKFEGVKSGRYGSKKVHSSGQRNTAPRDRPPYAGTGFRITR